MEEKISQDVGTEDSGEWPSHKEATVNAVQGEDWGWGQGWCWGICCILPV